MFKYLSKYVCAVLFLISLSYRGEVQSQGRIDGGLVSTLRIAARLCLGDHSQRITGPFFGCYDQAPGKAQFVKCQKQTYGFTLSTPSKVTRGCLMSYLIPVYAICLMREFRQVGINMRSAVTPLNVCQGRVLGLS